MHWLVGIQPSGPCYPSEDPNNNNGRAIARRYIRLNDEDVVTVCTLIATAEYCSEVVGALGRSVAKTLGPALWRAGAAPRPTPKTLKSQKQP